jgi:hypothetical protein
VSVNYLDINMECIDCRCTLERIHGLESMSYSDHEGVCAEFKINAKDKTPQLQHKDEPVLEIKNYYEAQSVINNSLKSISNYQKFWIIIMIILTAFLCLFNDFNIYLTFFKNTLLVTIITYLFLYVFFIKRIEKKTLCHIYTVLDIAINAAIHHRNVNKDPYL